MGAQAKLFDGQNIQGNRDDPCSEQAIWLQNDCNASRGLAVALVLVHVVRVDRCAFCPRFAIIGG